MSEGAYKKVGAKLVEGGYAAIPIMPGTKRPGELRKGEWVGKMNWREEYTRRLPSRFEIQLWAASDAGVCVVCGPASKHLVGVDIDTDDPIIRNAIIAALPETDLVKRGAKGETRFFRAPDIKESKSWNLPSAGQESLAWADKKKYRACDLIGPGRQTLLPPTVHPDTGRAYVWLGGLALEDTNPEDLPELTPEHIAAIDAALVPHGYEAEPERPEHVPARGGAPGIDYEKPIHRQLNDAALANLDAWIPLLGLTRCRKRPQGYEAVATWRASNGGQAIEKRKLNLKIARDGIQDFGDGPRPYTPLNLVIAALDVDREMAFGWLTDALGWNDERPIMLRPRTASSGSAATPEAIPETAPEAIPEVQPQAAPELPEKPVQAHGLTPAIISNIVPLPPPIALPAEFAAHVPKGRPGQLEALTRCPGLLGEIIDWIEATARRPNRVMALGVAATVIGTLIGRRVATPTRSATHLYIACLAPTGSGKQHPLDCLTLLLRSAQATNLIGPSEFISMPAVINMLMRQPLCLSAQDEFGSFLKRINARNASSFEKGISKIMRMVWGVSFAEYMTPEWAGRPASPIFAPSMSIYGVSTADEFFKGMPGAELDNGFLNRFAVIKTGRTEARTPEIEPGKVPEHIAAGLGEIYRWGGAPDSLATSRISDATMRPDPVVLRWASSQAMDAFRDLEQDVQKLIDRDSEMGWYMGRTAEIAIRLATIRAVGRFGPCEGSGPTVDRTDVEWGRDVAYPCGLQLAKEAKLHMAENDRQAWSNRILDLVRKNGHATPRLIQQKIRGALKSAEIKDILDGHCEAGLVEAVKGQQSGRSITSHYKYVGESQ